MALTQFQKVENVILLRGDNTYSTSRSTLTTTYNDFYYHLELFRPNAAWDDISDISQIDILPNPNSFNIFNPTDFYSIENSIDISSFIVHNEGSYDRGTFGIQESRVNGVITGDDNIVFNPLFIVLNGGENFNIGEFIYTDYELKNSTSKMLTDYEGERVINLTSYGALSSLNGKNYPNVDDLTTGVTLNVENNHIFFEVWLKSPADILGYGTSIQALRGRITNPDYGDFEKSRLDYIINADYINDATISVVETYYSGSWHTVSLTAGDVITDNTNFFYVYTSSALNGGVLTSKKYKYNVEDECNSWGYDTFNMMWINRLGGLESYNFKGKLNETISVSKDIYISSRFDIDSTTGYLDRSFNDENKKNYNTEVSDRFTLSTGMVDNDLGELFTDMIKSNYIVMVQDDGSLIPMTCLTNSLSLQNTKIKKLNNFVFDFTKNIRKNYKRF